MHNDLTPSEYAILSALWEYKHWITINELIEHFEVLGRTWKRQTINTFLGRLIEKKLVIKNGRKYMYALTKGEYDTLKAIEILDSSFGKSLKNFIAALSGGRSISSEEAEELKAYLDTLQL